MRTEPPQIRFLRQEPARPGAEARYLGRLHASGFTLIELLIVVTLLGLLVMLAQLSLFGALRRSTFKSQVQDFVSLMQMAASSAAETNRRYEVRINLSEQSYLLRAISSSNLAEVLDEEIIATGRFGDSCQVAYVEFDDGDYTNDAEAKFRVGSAGWQYGGKIVFLDESEQSYAVVVSRLVPRVEVIEGDPPLMTPKAKDEVPFL